jgi:hypothetical protein
MAKANHQANVVRVGEILPHPNADKLELTTVEGYQIVIGKGNFKTGDLAVYIQPDSVVPQTEAFRFIWNDHVGIDGVVPEKRRRITVKRLRKEYSEGLLMPLNDVLPEYAGMHLDVVAQNIVGMDVAERIGVTHYVPEFDKESTTADVMAAPRRRYPKTLRGWFWWTLTKLGLRFAHRSLALDVAFNYPVYDVDALKNHKTWIQPGDLVHVSEKIHGSNARYVYVDGVQYCGSREQWKKDGSNVWWNAFRQFPEIGVWCQANPGKVLYGEVGPTQKGFRYGAGEGETFFFAFDIYDLKGNPPTMGDPGGVRTWDWPGSQGFGLLAPTLYVGPFDDNVLMLADGKSVVPGATNVREGIVVRKVHTNVTLKVVSNSFLEKDSQ